MRSGRWVAVVGGLISLAFLAGCGGFTGDVAQQGGTQETGGVAGAKLAGRVYGGQQPIVGAQVYLFAANTTGYGGNGIAASSSNASVSLLTNTAGTTLDTSGGATNGDYYVGTSGVTVSCPSGGCFTITGDYTCAAGAQVYLYALGGNPGAGTNAAAGLMAALGSCPMAGNFAAATPYIVVNEVSTVAAAYAMAGFATDATHVSSSGTALAQVGIANAFANAGNLETLATGVALATTPAGNGAVPQAEMNTLANILAACVNSTGAVTGPTNPTACYTLFNNAESGGSTGAVPSDTATAAINLAHNPGSNIAGLYALGSATPPFAPALSAQPSDFTMVLLFTGGALNDPAGIAIDASGSVWVVNFQGNSVIKLASSGAILSGSAGYTGGGLSNPEAVAIDQLGDAWVLNDLGNAVTEFSNSGSLLSGANGYSGGGIHNPTALAIDGSDNVWIVNSSNAVTKLSNSGASLAGANGYTVSGGFGSTYFPQFVAIDSSGDAWISSEVDNSVLEVSTSGSVISPSVGYTGGGLDEPLAIGFDGSGDAWVANEIGTVSKLSPSGASLAGTNGYLSSGGGVMALDGSGSAWFSSYCTTRVSNSGSFLSGTNGYSCGGPLAGSGAMAIDGSGNIWFSIGYAGNNYVAELVGAATPVVTPLSVGVKNNALGTRP
jgi:streptogramin lyase